VGPRRHAGGAVMGGGRPRGQRAERPVRHQRRAGAPGARPVPRGHPGRPAGGRQRLPRLPGRAWRRGRPLSLRAWAASAPSIWAPGPRS
jgi:hypothetical protein